MITPFKNIKLPKLLRQKKPAKDSDNQEVSFSSEEGKYFCSDSQIDDSCSVSSDSCVVSGLSGFVETPPTSWKSAGEKGHHKGEPWVARPVLEALHERGLNPNLDPKTVSEKAGNLKIAMQRASQLPRNTVFGNSHVMVNRERERNKVPPINRSRKLDDLARWHAENMAEAAEGAFHAHTTDILERLEDPWQRIGSNVGVGECVKDIHMQMMQTPSMRNNILDRRYVEMGMATAKGRNGELYICQMYRG